MFIKPFRHLFLDYNLPIDIIFFSILLIILPIVLISGPALPDIIISLIGTYFIYKSVKYNLWSYYKNNFVILSFFFSCYLIIGAFLSGHPNLSLINEGSVFYFRYLFFILGIWYLLNVNPHISKCLLVTLFLSLSFVIFDGFIQYFLGSNIFGLEKHNSSRLSGLLIDEPVIGRYVSYFAIFFFFLVFQIYQLSERKKILFFIFLFISAIFVFMTGERTPTLVIFSFVLYVIIKNKFIRRIGLFFTLFSVLFISTLVYFNEDLKYRMTTHSINEISTSNIPYLPFSQTHEQYFSSAIKMFESKPIRGIGTNLFKYKCIDENFANDQKACSTHPHNFFIQLLAENGLIGVSFLIIFYLFLLVRSINFIYLMIRGKIDKNNFSNNELYIVLFLFWLPILPQMSFYNNWNNIFLMIPIGYMMYFLFNKFDSKYE